VRRSSFNRGCHLYSEGRPSRWALAHISSYYLNVFTCILFVPQIDARNEFRSINWRVTYETFIIIVAAVCNMAGHYIFALWFLSSIFYLSSIFFPRLISAAAGWMLPYFDTWCGLSASLECRSERCCTRLAANVGPKKSRQKSPSGQHPTTLSGYVFATKAYIDNRKKIVKLQYLLYMSPQYGELRSTSG